TRPPPKSTLFPYTTLFRSWFDERKENSSKPIGYILSLEGADSLVNLSYLEKAYANGLRICGPAHYGPGRYAPGTGEEGGLTALRSEEHTSELQSRENLVCR